MNNPYGVTLNLRYHPALGTIYETIVGETISHDKREVTPTGLSTTDDMLRTTWDAQGIEDPCFHDGVGLVKYQSGRIILVIVANCHKIRTKEEIERNPVTRIVELSAEGLKTSPS